MNNRTVNRKFDIEPKKENAAAKAHKSAAAAKPASKAGASVIMPNAPKTRKERRAASEAKLEKEREAAYRKAARQKEEERKQAAAGISETAGTTDVKAAESVDVDSVATPAGESKVSKAAGKTGTLLRKEFGEGRFLRRFRDPDSVTQKSMNRSVEKMIGSTETKGDANIELQLKKHGKRVQQYMDRYKTWRNAFASLMFVGVLCLIGWYLARHEIFKQIPAEYAIPLLVAGVVFVLVAVFVGIIFVKPLKRVVDQYDLSRGLSDKELKHVLERQKQVDLEYVQTQMKYLWITTKLPGQTGRDARRLKAAVDRVEARRAGAAAAAAEAEAAVKAEATGAGSMLATAK